MAPIKKNELTSKIPAIIRFSFFNRVKKSAVAISSTTVTSNRDTFNWKLSAKIIPVAKIGIKNAKGCLENFNGVRD